jgi:NADH:ubiquinone oxidoreductase subunit 6 (subunit J)
MNIEYIFIIFCFFSIVSALALILVNNPVHSILFLILVFCNISFILILLNVEFIAIIFLIVYVGAIAVLFLSVVMMLNLKLVVLQETF